MRILVTGNLGYVGTALTKYLAKNQRFEIHGVDIGLFESQKLRTNGRASASYVSNQMLKDVRDLKLEDLERYDVVVHLAAVSNDPMGEEFSYVTEEINQGATIQLAELCEQAGVEHLIFASSCSVYGYGGHSDKSENDEVNPLTTYAKSKIDSEVALSKVEGKLKTTSLRFATACGASASLRTDLVLNDFVWNALASRTVSILSDGSPWRPLIDVEDMAQVVSWMIRNRDRAPEQHLVINAGSNGNNFQVKEIADTVARIVPGTTVRVNENAQPDKRSYRVNFSKLQNLTNNELTFKPLEQSAQELVSLIFAQNFEIGNVPLATLKRLSVIRNLQNEGHLDKNLRWLED